MPVIPHIRVKGYGLYSTRLHYTQAESKYRAETMFRFRVEYALRVHVKSLAPIYAC